MTARQIELKRLASEAREMSVRWAAMASRLETAATVANECSAAMNRLNETVDVLVRLRSLSAEDENRKARKGNGRRSQTAATGKGQRR